MAGGFWNLAREEPGALALVEPDGTEVTAGELLARSNRQVHGLRALGLQTGDSLAVLLPNGAPVIELYLAALQAGWYLVPVNHHLVGPEVAYIVGDCDAKAFVAHERFADVAAAAAEESGFPKEARFAVGAGGIDGFRDYDELTEHQPADDPADRTAGAVMNYTSGTTGRPKGVRRKLTGLDPDTSAELFSMFLMLFGIQARDGNVHLVASPLYHTAVLVFAGNSLHLGHTAVLMDKWTPEGTLARIERHRVTTSHMVPTQFHRLLALPDDVKARYDVSSLRHVVHAAAPCPVEVKRRMIEWWGPVIDEYYAASEGGGTLVTSEQWLTKPGTVGPPWPGADVKVLDDDGNEVPPGEVGTVYMSLAQADFEYHKDPEKTQKNRVGGYFTVGDVGLLDEDGWLFLRDRKIDMIISGGANIYPAEIEGVLLTHPKVGDAAAFGIPHDDWGEEVKAVVEPAAGVEPSDELAREILEFCEGRLAKFKMPKSIDFIAEMPRDPNGKLYKRRLRDPYWEGRERAI
jgi:long-chain acyl-CoA synthetase